MSEVCSQPGSVSECVCMCIDVCIYWYVSVAMYVDECVYVYSIIVCV